MPLPPAPVTLIAGPTASGKSAWALERARACDGVILNADALQLYADLRILTARPTAEEEARVEHRLYGVADAAEAWSVGRWTRAAAPLIAELVAEGRPVFVVGGTGLYFRALTRGLADVPAVAPEVRAEAAALFERIGEAAFRERLRAVDAAAEHAIFPGDRQRLQRAWEVAEGTGRALSAWREDTRPLLVEGSYVAHVLEPDRAELYGRCDARFAAMVDGGAVEEALALADRNLPADLPAMKAVGLRELAAYARGEIDRATAVALGAQATRRYAKRQLTWFRNQTPDWPRLKR